VKREGNLDDGNSRWVTPVQCKDEFTVERLMKRRDVVEWVQVVVERGDSERGQPRRGIRVGGFGYPKRDRAVQEKLTSGQVRQQATGQTPGRFKGLRNDSN
jgi:hypothetical protein